MGGVGDSVELRVDTVIWLSFDRHLTVNITVDITLNILVNLLNIDEEKKNEEMKSARPNFGH